jgi:hypothetical protein
MAFKISILPSLEELKLLFSYDKETGLLTRLSTGKAILGSSKCKYVIVGIGLKTFLAHRIIWKLVTGNDAAGLIDHEDCDGHNNRWTNLREADHCENLRNRGAPKNNTSGIKGVSFDAATGMWRASITVDYKATNLGRYSTLQQASEARRIASEKMHGQFARLA